MNWGLYAHEGSIWVWEWIQNVICRIWSWLFWRFAWINWMRMLSGYVIYCGLIATRGLNYAFRICDWLWFNCIEVSFTSWQS